MGVVGVVTLVLSGFDAVFLDEVDRDCDRGED